MTAELVGNLGRLRGQHPPDENGLTLVIRVIAGSPRRVNATQRCTACALTADALGLVTDSGAVYAVQLKQQRYKCLDVLNAAGTAAAFMTRLSRRLFVGCDDGEIYCYDYSSNSRLARLPGHRTQISSLSIKSDTEQLLSASTDAVLLWDMQTFRQRRMLSSAPYGSSQAVFSAAGNILAAAAGSAGYITIWHAKSLHELCRLAVPLDKQKQPFQASCISISPDELWLLVGCRSPALLLVYSLGQQQLSHALLLPEEMYGITQVHILPDSTSAAGELRLQLHKRCNLLCYVICSEQHDSDLHSVSVLAQGACSLLFPVAAVSVHLSQLVCPTFTCSFDQRWLHQLPGLPVLQCLRTPAYNITWLQS